MQIIVVNYIFGCVSTISSMFPIYSAFSLLLSRLGFSFAFLETGLFSPYLPLFLRLRESYRLYFHIFVISFKFLTSIFQCF